jgi:MFS family permease
VESLSVTPGQGGPRIRELLRKHDFRQLLFGFAVSSAGDWLYGVALLVYVYDRTGSAAWVGATTFVRLLPYILFGALGGVLADRYEKRTVIVATDLARAGFMLGLTLVAVSDGPAVLALVFAFVASAAGTPEGPALGSLLARVCEESQLARANSIMSALDHLAMVVGPAIGAVLLLLGSPATAFAVNGITFLVAAFLAARVRARTGSVAGAEEPSTRITEQLSQGIAGIRASGAASVLVVLMIAASALYGFELVFTVLVAEERLGLGSHGVGWLSAAVGAGGVVGATVAGRVGRSRRGDFVLLGTVFAMGLPFAVVAASDLVAAALVSMAVIGAGNILFEVIGMTILQRVIPEHLLGRVLGIQDSLSVAAMLAGSILAPVMVNLIGLRPALVAVGVSLPTVCLLIVPRLGELRKEANRMMDKLAPVVELLTRSGVFDGSSRQVLEAAAAAASSQEVAPGDVLIREGDEADDFYVIAEGSFEVISHGETQGPAATVNVLRTGDYFGEIGLLGRHRRTATVKAMTSGRVLRLTGAVFLESVQQAPTPPPLLMSAFANRLRKTHPSLDPSTQGGAGV